MSDFQLRLTDYDFYFYDTGSPNAEENFYDARNTIPWIIRTKTLPKNNYFVLTDNAKLSEWFMSKPAIFEETVKDATVHWQNRSIVNHLPYITSGVSWVGGNKFSFSVTEVGSTVYHANTAEQAYESGYVEVEKILNGKTLSTITSSDRKKLLIWANIGADVKNGEHSISGARDALRIHLSRLEYAELPIHYEPYNSLQSMFYKTVYKSPHRISGHIKENQASRYDIVFISYNEPNAEENWQALKARFPRAQRVDGVKGIHNAHIEAAKLCTTPMFWVVDGDAKVDEEFKFTYSVPDAELEFVHVWRSKNPVNDLTYGYGGVKLLPRERTLIMNTNTADMTTSISPYFKPMPLVSNITSFNTDPFNTWKSAFRECVKLSSKSIDRQHDDETEYRLTQWQFEGANRRYGKYAQMGAKQGQEYGEANAGNAEALKKINDFDWLKEKFENENT